MNQISIKEISPEYKYLLVTQKDDSETISSTRLVITDNLTNRISFVNISQGEKGDVGPVGPQGPPGQDASSFTVLSIGSGGTNNTNYSSGNILFFDGSKITTTEYSVQDLLDEAQTGANAITGILAGSGIYKIQNGNNVTLNTKIGDGLQIDLNNNIIVDNSIARISDLTAGSIEGIIPISKGGTNNNFYTQNRLIYFDGFSLKSFPLSTGNFLFSGVSVQIVAGSGLVGGGSLSIPSGSIVINIPQSADILVEENAISLTPTGTPGTYSKVVTDSKGRVIQGSTLTNADIIQILGYTPFHAGNDGIGSNLDADLLDGQHGSFYRNATNVTGILNTTILPSSVEPGTYTKFAVASNGLISGVFFADQNDIISSLGYTPVSSTGLKNILGTTNLNGDVNINGELFVYDNLPLLSTNNSFLLPDTPRGISFIYGGLFTTKTGIIAYYPAEDQLKLVTNIFASGADTDGGGNQDDLNGGDAESIFLLQNLDGDASTILLREIADNLYVKLNGNEDINGIKSFNDSIIFRKPPVQINNPIGNASPPLTIGGNTIKVTSLNSDLLDDQHGFYYRNAANVTGSFSYNNVTFDHIEGTHNFIPRFDDTINDPAGRISESNLYQDNSGNIRTQDEINVIVGTSNPKNSINTLTVGVGHIVDGDNNLLVGTNNIVSGNNSIALNNSCIVDANNSIAAHSYGRAYVSNQIALGAFLTKDDSNVVELEHGQHTSIMMHLPGTQAGETWSALTPTITIPENKTFAYNVDVLISRAFGTGVAQYRFDSGIFKNATFRDSNNVFNVINVTTQPQLAKKNEVFNNSQIKNHFHTLEHTNGSRQLQEIRTTHPPLQYNPVITENTKTSYFYTKVNKQCSGTYYKTNYGDLILDINKPIYSGIFNLSDSTYGIKITSKNHGIRTNSSIDLRFENITGLPLPLSNGPYNVFSVINQDTFFVEQPYYSGYISYSAGSNTDFATITLDSKSIVAIDNKYISSGINAVLNNNTISNLSDNNFIHNLRIDTPIIIQSGSYFFNRLVKNYTSNSIVINDPIATGAGSQQYVILNGSMKIYQIDFSFNFFKKNNKFLIKTNNDGDQVLTATATGNIANFQGPNIFATNTYNFPIIESFYSTGNNLLQTYQNTHSVTGLDYTNQPTIILQNFIIPKRSSYGSGIPVRITPLSNNSGSAFLPHKQTISGSFAHSITQFNPYRSVYKKYDNNYLVVHYTGIDKSLNLSFTPITYELVDGFNSTDNNFFDIVNINDKYYLQTKYMFNYETKNIYNIRVKATDRQSKNFLEKPFSIVINNKISPYSLSNIPHQEIYIDSLFDYTVSSNVFVEEEQGGPLSYSAKLQDGRDLPYWLFFDENAVRFTGIPSYCDLGTYNIRVLCSNNFDTIAKDFFLKVLDPSFETLSYSSNFDPSITNITISSDNIDENLISGTIFSELNIVGSYNPYIEFLTGENSFTGIFSNNSDIVECLNRFASYPTTTVSGTAGLLAKNSTISVPVSLGLSNLVATNVYKPFALSGTPALSNGNVFITNAYSDYSDIFFSGLEIQTDYAFLPKFFTTKFFTDYYVNIGARQALAIETSEDDIWKDLILAENNDVIVIAPSPLTNTLLSTELKELISVDKITQTQNEEDDILIANDRLTINTFWSVPYSGCDNGLIVDKQIILSTSRNSLNNRSGINTLLELHNTNNPPLVSLISGCFDVETEQWYIRDPLYNPVLSLYGFGSPDFCTFLTEDNIDALCLDIGGRQALALETNEDDILRDLILAENNDVIVIIPSPETVHIISNNDRDHGSRVVLDNSYEILESKYAVKDNGKLLANSVFEDLLCENQENLVHDYAIASRSGDLTILYPGYRENYISLTYPYLESNYDFSYAWGELIPFDLSSSRYFIRMNKKYLGNNTTNLITYSETLPINNNYVISGLKQYAYASQSGDCPVEISISGVAGFESVSYSTGNYITGVLDLYTEPGTGTITLNFSKDVNLDSRHAHNLNLYNFSSTNSNLQLPVTGQYKDLSIVDSNTITINNLFFKPNSGIQSLSQAFGLFSCNLDRNHEYIVNNNAINRVPVIFRNSINRFGNIDTNIASRPKNYTFDILNISGNKIYAKDNLNYLLKENNRPYYLDQDIKSNYITNGIAFSGSLFKNHQYIYDIRYNQSGLDNTEKLINFKYNHQAQNIILTVPSGFINPYDFVKISFPTGFDYSNFTISGLVTKSSILTDNISIDLEPDKDHILLETSTNIDASSKLLQIKLPVSLPINASRAGTCTINNSPVNRLQSGLLINYQNSDRYGYEIESIKDGFSFTGVVPKNHLVLSANISGLLDSNHMQHASVFSSGNTFWYSGARILRQTNSNDIGFAEYYLINTNINNLKPTNLSGVGSSSSPYSYNMNSSGNRYLEFLYLGHNTNQINITGMFSMISGGLYIYHTNLSEQFNQYRSYADNDLVIKDTLVYSGINTNGGLNLNLNISRFDKIKIELVSTTGVSNFNFRTYVTSDVPIKPYILESSGNLNPSLPFYPFFNPDPPTVVYSPPTYSAMTDPKYNIFTDTNFYILPYIKVTKPYCDQDYNKNQQLFYNGNIIDLYNFDSIRSYLLFNDELEIIDFNNSLISTSGDVCRHILKFNPSNEELIVSGLSLDGNLSIPPKPLSLPIENTYRHNIPFGLSYNQLLSNTGTIRFVKSVSGNIDVYNYNNLFYHTYGGSTASFPLDSSGVYVNPPQTGSYRVIYDPESCMSGTLCVIVSGYRTNAFTGFVDIRDRSNFYTTPNIVDVNGIKGAVRPYGTNKRMFFDFNDGFPEISDFYSVEDLIQPNVLSIKIPYNNNYVGRSGLVLLIDSHQNIKSNLSPNINNTFSLNAGTCSITPSTIFNYYDRDSKRWKHTVHLEGPQQAFGGYNLVLSGKSSKLYSINPESIQISGISYSIDDGVTFYTLTNNITIPDNLSRLTLRITTLQGDQKLFEENQLAMPKVSISGLSNYYVEFNEPSLYGWHGKGWNIGVKITPPPPRSYTNKNIIIRVKDLTGFDQKTISLNKTIIPEIRPFATGFVINGSSWQLGFDVTKIDIEDKIFKNEIDIDVIDIPISNNYQILHSDSKSIILGGGTSGANTGIYYPKVILTDISTSPYTILSSGSGALVVGSSITQKQPYSIQFNNLQPTYYFDLSNPSNLTFDIPADLGPEPSQVLNNLVITFNNDIAYSLVVDSSSYNYDTKRIEIIAIPTTTGNNPVYYNQPNKFISQSVNISIKQPVYDTFGNYSYQTYSKTAGFNVVFYQPVGFQPISQLSTIPFAVTSPWSIEFYVLSGIGQFDPQSQPNVSIFNTPNIGHYENNPIEYSLDYDYDNVLKKWKVTASSTRDVFNRYIDQTGIYPISIYIDDDFSSSVANNTFSIRYNPITKMKNINSTLYSTPDSIFYTKVDIEDDIQNISNSISFPPTLKESSVRLLFNKTVRKYDTDLGIWENSYTSDRMTDKYDAQILIENNILSIECQGIGSDKIIAVAKLNTMEIESNELQGIPLTITGIAGYSPDGAIPVEQGENPWILTFKTVGGLAHINYPPTIILDNMPTFCSGYNPLIEDQPQCVKEPVWNPNDMGGSWSYSFSGIPSCTLLGLKPFSITAIDTDPSLLPSSPYLPDTDYVEYAFEYTAGFFSSGEPPLIVPVEGGNETIKPLCGILYSKQVDFGPSTGTSLCGVGPTGIKLINVSGSLPSGLSYTIFFPEDLNFPVEPYSNLGSGYLRIEGYPLTFASGSSYPEKITLKVTDARNLSNSLEINFSDSSTPNDPDISVPIYFDSDQLLLTPFTGTRIITAANTSVWRPSPSPESLACRSILPHNKCRTAPVFYSGFLSLDTRIYLTSLDQKVPLEINDDIYINFETPNDNNDGPYTVMENENGIYILGNVSLISNATGIANFVSAEYKTLNISNFNTFFQGSIIDSTSYCLLGAGRARTDNSSRRGIMGLIGPSYQATITGSTFFESSNTKLSGLQLTRINTQLPVSSFVSWSDCWQTGRLYLSGIVLPSINAEITDPPPAQNRLFTFNNLVESLFPRLAFGNTETQKNLIENQRSKTLNYFIKDLISGVIISEGTTSPGNPFLTPILNRNSGTVYQIKIWNDSDIFPTYNHQAIPYSENDYIWIHKGDLFNTLPTQKTFPPVVTYGFDSISVINDLEDLDPNGIVMDPVYGIAIGGYIPTDDGIGLQIPYSHTGVLNNALPWSVFNYKPIISGIMQKSLTITGTLVQKADTAKNELVIKNNNINYSINDIWCIDKNNYNSTALYFLDHPGEIFVSSGNGSLIYLQNSDSATGWLSVFSSGDTVFPYQNIENDNIKIMPYNIVYNAEGRFTFQITGRCNTRENETLTYKIATMENPNMPIFDKITYPLLDFVPKKYFQNYPLYVNKPLKIIGNSIIKTNNSLSFNIFGGERPIDKNFPDVQLAAGINGDFSYCGFWRNTTGTGNTIVDEYDSINDRLNIKLTLSSDYGINWSAFDTIKIKVSDDTGSDSYIYSV